MHRSGRRLGSVLACAALLVAVFEPVPAYSTAPLYSAWRLDAGNLDFMPLGSSSGERSAERHRAGIFSTFSNPYMLEGLVACGVVAVWSSPTRSARLDWHHLGHALYREDRLEAALRLALPAAGFFLTVLPTMERREVTGFESVYAHSLSLGASYERGGRLCIAIARSAYESDPDEPPCSALRSLLREGPIALALDYVVSGEHAGNATFALEARLNNTCSIVSGYRWQTAEVSIGIVFRLVPVVLDFSWGENPALGSTLSAGAGRWWKW